MYSPTLPTAGQPWGSQRGLPGGLLFVQAPSSFVPRLESRDLSKLKIILTIQVTAIK